MDFLYMVVDSLYWVMDSLYWVVDSLYRVVGSLSMVADSLYIVVDYLSSVFDSLYRLVDSFYRVNINSPRRTSTSPLWRPGQQHLRPSPASGPSTPSCPRGTTDSRQSRLRLSVRGVLARSKPVRTWGVGLHDIPAMRERPLS